MYGGTKHTRGTAVAVGDQFGGVSASLESHCCISARSASVSAVGWWPILLSNVAAVLASVGWDELVRLPCFDDGLFDPLTTTEAITASRSVSANAPSPNSSGWETIDSAAPVTAAM